MNHDGYGVVLWTIMHVLSLLVRLHAGLEALNHTWGSVDAFGGAAASAGWSAPHEEVGVRFLHRRWGERHCGVYEQLWC